MPGWPLQGGPQVQQPAAQLVMAQAGTTPKQMGGRHIALAETCTVLPVTHRVVYPLELPQQPRRVLSLRRNTFPTFAAPIAYLLLRPAATTRACAPIAQCFEVTLRHHNEADGDTKRIVHPCVCAKPLACESAVKCRAVTREEQQRLHDLHVVLARRGDAQERVGRGVQGAGLEVQLGEECR